MAGICLVNCERTFKAATRGTVLLMFIVENWYFHAGVRVAGCQGGEGHLLHVLFKKYFKQLRQVLTILGKAFYKITRGTNKSSLPPPRNPIASPNDGLQKTRIRTTAVNRTPVYPGETGAKEYSS